MDNERRTPLYVKIQEFFIDQIATGKLKANEKIATEKELMEKFDVSRITVANALSGLAKDGWIYRIPGRGSFVKENTDQLIPSLDSMDQNQQPIVTPIPLSKSTKRVIGLIIPSISDFFAIRLNLGIAEIVNNDDFYLVIILSNDIKGEKLAIKELLRMGVAGLLIFPTDGENYSDEILTLKVEGFPFVLIDRYLPGVETNCIYSDNLLGSKMAVSHLYDLGHREIAICSDSALKTISVNDRISGYMKELELRGEMINPALLLTGFTIDYEKLDPDTPLFRYMRNRLATAYIALNAKLGLHMVRMAKQIGLSIPEDISIMTFDDPSSGYDDNNNYTHIAQSEREMGREAAKMLIELIRQEPKGKGNRYRKIVLDPQLIIGGSTGPLKPLSDSPLGTSKL